MTVKITYAYKPGGVASPSVDLSSDSCSAAVGGANNLLQSLGHNAWDDYLWTAVSCSSDPVVVGTTFTIVNVDGQRWGGWSPVLSIEKSASGAFDVPTGSEFFGFGFGVVVFFYLLGLKGSVILRHFWRH